jgi:hypothetical protein
MVSFFLGIFIIFAMDFINKMKGDFENSRKMEEIQDTFSDTPILLTIKKGHIRISQGDKTLAISEPLKQDTV